MLSGGIGYTYYALTLEYHTQIYEHPLLPCRVEVRAGWRARWLWQRRRRRHLIILQLPVGLSASFVLCRFICSLSCPCRHHENHTKHRHLLRVLLGTTHRRLRLSDSRLRICLSRPFCSIKGQQYPHSAILTTIRPDIACSSCPPYTET